MPMTLWLDCRNIKPSTKLLRQSSSLKLSGRKSFAVTKPGISLPGFSGSRNVQKPVSLKQATKTQPM